ncbi:MAG: alpha-L-arabinofuranosidase [Actinomycetota bacterium]
MRFERLAAAGLALSLLTAACSGGGGDDEPSITLRAETPVTTVEPADPEPLPVDVLDDQAATLDPGIAVGDRDIVIDLTGAGAPFDRRLLGSNLPAWLGPSRDSLDFYHPAIDVAGVEVLRFPGGSWSNDYDWLACLDGLDGCFWPWAMTVADFARVMSDVDESTEFVWTIHYNGTPEEAAALVAFFNGDVDDQTVIGVDADGVDWGVEAQWAQRRVDLGFADPIGVRYWEIGNEIYGAAASAGPQCASFGWENVATCDGTEYMLGIDDQAGLVEYAAAIRAVDPASQIGAVGVAPAGAWSDFGNEVLAAADGHVDFYIVHWYGYDNSPDPASIPGRAQEAWPASMAGLREAMAGWGVPELAVAVTEYNLVSFRDGDTDAVMRTAANAFFTAETIGAMALSGVEIANHWNLFDGEDGLGTSYGLVDADSGEALPVLFGFRSWSLMGTTLRPVVGDAVTTYATSGDDGSVQIMLLNPSDDAVSLSIGLEGGSGPWEATADVMTASDLAARSVSYNGAEVASVLDLTLDPIGVGRVDGDLEHTLDPRSITVLRLTPIDPAG